MTNSKMTEREIYTAMMDGTLDADVAREFAEKKLAQLDKRNASAAKRAAAKRAEGDELREAVYEVLTETPTDRGTITDLVNEAIGGELSAAKVGARLNALFKDGRISKENIKIAGEDGKQKTVVGYFIAE